MNAVSSMAFHGRGFLVKVSLSVSIDFGFPLFQFGVSQAGGGAGKVSSRQHPFVFFDGSPDRT